MLFLFPNLPPLPLAPFRPASEYSSPGRPLSCIVDENTPISTNGATPTTALPPSDGDQRAQERRVRSQRHRNYMSRTHLHTPPDLPEGYGQLEASEHTHEQFKSSFTFTYTLQVALWLEKYKADENVSTSLIQSLLKKFQMHKVYEAYVLLCIIIYRFCISYENRFCFHYELCHHCNAVVLIVSPLPSSVLNTGLSNPANLCPHSVQLL